MHIHHAFTLLLVLSIAVPFLRVPHWSVRVLDYPRLQKCVLLVICLATLPLVVDHYGVYTWIVLGLSLPALGYLLWRIVPYTPLGKPMLDRVKPRADEPVLRMLVCNVLQDNRDFTRTAALITERKPDVLLLLETDEGWRQGVQAAVADYPFKLEIPKDNTYGLLFYCRLPVLRAEVKYLIDPEIPSIEADVEFAGRTVRLYGLHPTPPVPQENAESTDRDAEVLITGRAAAEWDKPCIVFGDLNDVAWSRTTRLFLKTSGLLDPRRGRGMFSTFHAEHRLLRWPLDHFFVSSRFRLVDMRVERNVGSDHFPISLDVVLRHDDDSGELEATKAEEREIDERIAAAE